MNGYGEAGSSQAAAWLTRGMTLLAFAAPIIARADTAGEIAALKARLRALEAKAAATKPEVARVAEVEPTRSAPPPVFVSFRNGLFVESEDKRFDFKIGGRIQTDGGFAASADTIRRSNVGLRRAELEFQGRAFTNWFYRFQYDFATTTGTNALRDAYLAYRDKFLPAGVTAQPVTIQIGNFHEPFGLETLESDKHATFMERGFPANISPARHIGAAIAAGDRDWAVKAGVFSTSPQDTAIAPPAGGAQYWDAAVRGIYAPIVKQDAFVHLGASFVYHKPNSSSGGTDSNNLLPGASTFEREETGILGGGGATVRVPATQDLSCAASAASLDSATGSTARRPSCLKYSFEYGFEAAAAYGPVSLQAEYVGSRYERDPLLVFLYANGGGSSLHYSSYYILCSLFLTGESRAESYNGYDKNWSAPGTFGDVAIKHPLNKGGLGAFELAARYSEIDLDNGGLVPASFVYAATAAGSAAQKAIAKTATLGGRQENLTMALNWYPVRGVRVQVNWTRAMTLIAPSDRPYLDGKHPSLLIARAQVFW